MAVSCKDTGNILVSGAWKAKRATRSHTNGVKKSVWERDENANRYGYGDDELKMATKWQLIHLHDFVWRSVNAGRISLAHTRWNMSCPLCSLCLSLSLTHSHTRLCIHYTSLEPQIAIIGRKTKSGRQCKGRRKGRAKSKNNQPHAMVSGCLKKRITQLGATQVTKETTTKSKRKRKRKRWRWHSSWAMWLCCLKIANVSFHYNCFQYARI